MRITRLAVLMTALLLMAANPASSQQACPCVPLTPLWTVTTCDNWNCAMSTLVNANGDPLVFALPVGTSDAHWIVMRRVAAGGYTNDGSDSHVIEQFDRSVDAGARFDGMSADYRPMMVTAPDGRFLVISLRTPVSTTHHRATAP